MSELFDVAVIGAGPAGSVAATVLARAGLSVALIERHPVPRAKVCGDALIPDAIGLLRDLGLWEEIRISAHPVHRCRVYAPDASHVELAIEAVTLRRETLDACLAQQAVRSGASLRDRCKATDVRVEPSGATLAVETPNGQQTLRSRLAILACGADTGTMRRFGLLERSSSSAVAMRTYYRLPGRGDATMLQLWYQQPIVPGYGWIFPMGDEVYNVGVGIFRRPRDPKQNLADLFTRFTRECVDARGWLEGGEELQPIRGAPLRTSLRGCRPSSERLLACGEAIGATYAFTGEGIGKAMQTGKLAAEIAIAALSQDTLSAEALRLYDAALDRDYRDYYGHYDTAEKWLRHPWVCNLVAGRARASPRIRRMLEDVLAERRRPTEILSFRGLVNALLDRVDRAG